MRMGTLSAWGGGSPKEIFFFGLSGIVHIFSMNTYYFYNKENPIICLSPNCTSVLTNPSTNFHLPLITCRILSQPFLKYRHYLCLYLSTLIYTLSCLKWSHTLICFCSLPETDY